ncbi:MAG: UDP-N-acetylmuramoyl-L-alanine--D-glutamate ligase, partial [Patescibacteria group bacterium]
MDKIAILGFGREGKSLLKFLKETPKYRDAEIEILDQKQGKDYLKNLSDFDLVFRSPGVPYNLSEIQRAIKNGVKFSSATKLFFDLCTAKIIGITGTKGKGTTSTILYQILKKCGRDVYL